MPQANSTWKRSIKLLGLGTKLAAQEVGNKIFGKDKLQGRVKQAQQITEALSELKGAAMKAGQLLSLDSSDLIPPEVSAVLSKLQSNATPMPYVQVEELLKSELGPEKFAQIQNLSQMPIGSASIGQVHKAQINNQDIAIKVQYPDVKQSIDSDLKIIRKTAESFMKISGKSISLEGAFSELRQVLYNEVDYHKEAEFMSQYAMKLNSIDGFKAPMPNKEFSTERVLCMNWLDGIPILDWIQSTPTKEDRLIIAKKLLDLFCLEFVDWGLVQTDPNFANFKINPESLELQCLDFGASINYDKDFRTQYAHLLTKLRSGSVDELFEVAIANGLLSSKEPREVQIAFKKLMQVSLEPFDPNRQPFVFADKDFEKRTLDANLQFGKLLKYSSPPRQILFLHRKLGGIFNLLKKLDVQIDLLPYWERMTSINRVD